MSEETDQNIALNNVISNAARITSFAAPLNYEVSAGDIVSNYNLSSGDVLTVLSGGITSNITIFDGGVEHISSGGVGISTNILGGGKQYVDGGTVNNALLALSFEQVYRYYGGNSRYQNISGGENDIYETQYIEYKYPASEQYVMSGGIVNGGTLSSWHSNTAVGGGWTTAGYQQSVVISYVTSANQYISSGGVVNKFELVGNNTSQFVYSGGVAVSTKIGTEAKQFVYSDGFVSDTIISGGTQYLFSGAITNNTTLSGGIQRVNSGVVVSGVNVYDGTQYLSSGTIASNTILNGGTQQVNSGAIVNNTYIYSGKQILDSGAIVSNTHIDGGVLVVYGNIDQSDIIFSTGTIVIGSTGVVTGDFTLASNKQISVLSDGCIEGNVIVNSNGSLYLDRTSLLQGEVTLNPGGKVQIGVSNGGSVDLIGDTNRGLTISGYMMRGVDNNVTTLISGFSGQSKASSDRVQIDGLQAANISSVTYPDDNHIKFGLLDGTSLTLNMIGIKQTGYSLGSDIYGNSVLMVCFLSGTMIKMTNGFCAVEDIQVGDTVLTYSPRIKKNVKKKVTWVGKKSACVNSRLPDDQAGYPVRILKDTFKKGVPNKDLLITPEHCLFIDGYFVPARMLVNGRSIYYDYSITNYDFYHIETEDHSVIWADGMLTESYLNTGNRHKFNTDQKVVSLDLHVKVWENDAIAPLNVDRHFVEPIFNRLVKRATKHKLLQQKENNFVLCKDHGLYLLTEEGQAIYQIRKDRDKIIFNLPANTQGVYLVSRKSRPCDVIGPFIDDRRNLGVLVGQVDVFNRYGVYPVRQYLKHTELKGWSVVEQSACRWTMGCAFLPLDVYNTEYPFAISIEVISAGPYLVKKDIKEEEKIAV